MIHTDNTATLQSAIAQIAKLTAERDELRAKLEAKTTASDTYRKQRNELRVKLAALEGREPFDDWPEYHSEAMGCGLEDRNITNRYEAMQYGWHQALDRVAERLEGYAAAGADPVPEGWQLVPVDPTPEMIGELQSSAWLPGCYKAMLAVAPKEPT